MEAVPENIPPPITDSTDPWLERLRQRFDEYKEVPLDLQTPAQPSHVQPEFHLPLPRDFREPLALAEQVDLTNVVQRRLPRQVDLDKILNQIQRKILHQVHLTEELKDIKAHYQASPHFKQIYQYLSTGRTTGSPQQVRQTIAQSVNYFLLDELLFRIHKDPQNDWKGLLCLPSSLLPQILSLYHSSLFGSHMGISKSLATLSQRFYCPEMAKQVRAYILGCHICQTFKDNKRRHGNPLNQRVTIDTPALTRISMDIKHMPPGINGYNFILVLCCEMSNYIIACPLRQTRSPEICVNILKSLIAPFGVPEVIISDQDPAFLSSIMQYFYQQFDIKLIVCGPTNHKSLKAESAIKTLSTALMKHLTEKGTQWPLFLPFSVLSCNSFHTPNLNGFAPIQLVLGRIPKLIPHIELSPEIMVSKTFEAYYQTLRNQLAYMRERLHKLRDQRLKLQNQYREFTGYRKGQLVYLYHPLGAALQTGSKKICARFVGPLVIYGVLDPQQYILMSLDGKIFPNVVEVTRLKPGSIQSNYGEITTLSELMEVLRKGQLITKPQE